MTTSLPSPAHDASAPAELMVDVRTAAEYRQGHLEGAINLPLDQLLQRLPAALPDRHGAMLLYCASGGRSGMACAALQQLGYTRARNGGGLGLAALSTGRPIVQG